MGNALVLNKDFKIVMSNLRQHGQGQAGCVDTVAA